MATTSRAISELTLGIRDTAGAVVASGKVRFYQPGTLTPRDVYSDDVCTLAITQPLTLNAGGQYPNCFALEPVRMIAKNSDETTTYVDTIVNLNRHDAVYVTTAGFNSGTETTLEAVLAEFTTGNGAGASLKESAGATARAPKDVIYEREISVLDFGAVGDGTTPDHVAIQACIDRVEARGGGVVFLPEGTYLINSGLSIDAVKVRIRGDGRGVSVIKNGSTSATAITVNMGSAIDCKLTLRDFSITASTTSSGNGILVSNGERIDIQNVSVALHRTGIDTNAVGGARIRDCIIESTDDNAAAIGIYLGTQSVVDGCTVVSATDNGRGVVIADASGRAANNFITNFGTGIYCDAVTAVIRDNRINSATTGINAATGADGVRITDNTILSGTTAISVGAVDGAYVERNTSTCTTDLSVNASATLIHEHNSFTTYSNSGATPSTYPGRFVVTTTSTGSASPTWAVTHSPLSLQLLLCTSTSATAVTVSNPTVTNAQPGDVLRFLFVKQNANAISGITWGDKFVASDSGPWLNAPANPGSEQAITYTYIWTGTVYLEVDRSPVRSI